MTDAAMNIALTLEDKVSIIENSWQCLKRWKQGANGRNSLRGREGK